MIFIHRLLYVILFLPIGILLSIVSFILFVLLSPFYIIIEYIIHGEIPEMADIENFCGYPLYPILTLIDYLKPKN